jgi:hypothetical protein
MSIANDKLDHQYEEISTFFTNILFYRGNSALENKEVSTSCLLHLLASFYSLAKVPLINHGKQVVFEKRPSPQDSEE